MRGHLWSTSSTFTSFHQHNIRLEFMIYALIAMPGPLTRMQGPADTKVLVTYTRSCQI